MNRDERRALESIRLDWATTPDDIWQSQSDVHVAGLHDHAFRDVMAAFGDTEPKRPKSPLGVVIPGPAGAGKTHLLGEIRAAVQQQNGYFFLVDMLSGDRFWSTILNTVLDDFSRPAGLEERTQLQVMLWRLSDQAGLSDEARAPIVGSAPLEKAHLDTFITSVFKVHAKYRRRAQNTLRALVLAAAEDQEVNDLGYIFLQPHDTDDSVIDSLRPWGIQPVTLTDQDVVESVSQLLALTGPSVMAVDQIDTIIGGSTRSTQSGAATVENETLEKFAHGLMSMRQNLHRTVTVVACLPAGWAQIEDQATATVKDRFRAVSPLERIPSPDFARAMVEHRFETCFRKADFNAPTPTWPVTASAFKDANQYTPRALLQNIDKHIRECLAADAVTDMTTLAFSKTIAEEHKPTTEQPEPTDLEPAGTEADPALEALDKQFEALQDAADTSAVLDDKQQDAVFPPILLSGFRVWVQQSTRSDESWTPDPLPSSKPSVHGRITRSSDTDTVSHQWYFRAVAATNANSAISKIQKASDYASLTQKLPNRHVVLLRNDPWPTGPKTAETVREFHTSGGTTLPIQDNDIRVLIALHELLAAGDADLGRWISARKPALHVSFLKNLLPSPHTQEDQDGHKSSAASDPKSALAADHEISIGETQSGSPIKLQLSALRKHTAIFAGSGSGKTVLIRRIIEECALQGVSSIVIDSNNDLARLSQPWPADSTVHTSADQQKRATFFESVDVVVWTPNRVSGSSADVPSPT